MGALIGIIISILLMILQYKMLCHLIINPRLEVDNKKGWVLGFILVGGIASIVYYFSEYKKVE